MKPKIIRASTVSMSLDAFCKDILKELSENYDVIALSSPDDLLDEVGKREGVRVIGVPMERRISPITDLKSLLKLVKVLRQEEPDMVHSMTPKAGLLCMMAGWLVGVPVRVHTFTGLVWPTEKGLKRRILMATDWITCACATHVIPEGYGVLEDLRDHITKKPMKVLGYGNVRGIDLQYWQVNSSDEGKRKKEQGTIDSFDEGKRSREQGKKDTSVDKNVFTFLFVGRIVGDKGINELVKAFNMLIERKKEKGEEINCRLVLVGGYEEKLDPVSMETRRLIDEIPEIEAVGPQYGEDLKAWYAAADCFVFPSYREGFPNTVIEAGAMELPSIVTDINGSREIIVEGVEGELSEVESMELNGVASYDAREQSSEERRYDPNKRLKPGERMSIRESGVVIPSKNVDALYDAMVWMLEHPEERKEMGQRAREIVSERFEQGFVRQCLYDFYKEVLGE